MTDASSSRAPLRIVQVDPLHPDAAVVAEAAAVIARGGLVAFPTETVYGLGANALDAGAVARIFAAKGRPADDPLIVHVASRDEVARVAGEVPEVAQRLMDRFWPGPLTLVLPRSEAVPLAVTSGGPTVAVRCPAHPVARALIAAAGVPIAAPSANRFAHTSPTRAEHVAADLDGRIDLIVDGGPCEIGVESTVLDLSGPVPALLRPGGVPLEALVAELGTVHFTPGVRALPHAPAPSPGLLDRHYAPGAPLQLVVGDDDAALRAVLARELDAALARGERVGLVLPSGDLHALERPGADVVQGDLGALTDLDAVARNLFRVMREVDAAAPDLILARDVPDTGIGRAIRDRLRRAARSILRA